MPEKRRAPDDFVTYDAHGSDYSVSHQSDSESDNNTCMPLMNAVARAFGTDNSRHPSIARKKSSPTEAERLIADDLNKMSLQERNRLNEELHGVADDREEDAHFLSQQLEVVEAEIARIRPREAYNLALFLNPAYVKNAAFRLMFLRADDYDPRKAAVRIVRHFDGKMELFGRDRVVSTIRWEDLTDHDLQVLRAGSMQIFPELKDTRGRTILLDCLRKLQYTTVMERLRVGWYLIMGMLRDEEVQRRGVVVVADRLGAQLYNIQLGLKMAQNSKALPIRIVATHFCFDDRQLRTVISMAQMGLNKESRVRFRSHFGSTLECQYNLKSFGIPQRAFQADDSADFMRYLNHLREQDATQLAAANAEGRIDNPKATDVILGRGRPYINYPGNKRFVGFIGESFRSRYQALTDRNEKTVMAEAILQMIKNDGVRFLKRDLDRGTWIEAENLVAREKVSHALRSKASVKHGNAE